MQIPVQWCYACAELCKDDRLSLAKVVIHALSVFARLGGVDSTHVFPERRRYLRSRLPQAFLGILHHSSAHFNLILCFPSLFSRTLRELLRSLP
jgi:hypothetical protein